MQFSKLHTAEEEASAAVSCHSCVSDISFGGAGIAQRVERRTRDRKVAGSSPGMSGRRMFFSRVNFLC